MYSKWETLKSEIGIFPVGVKGKAGRIRSPWLMRNIEGLFRKKEAWVTYGYWDQVNP